MAMHEERLYFPAGLEVARNSTDFLAPLGTVPQAASISRQSWPTLLQSRQELRLVGKFHVFHRSFRGVQAIPQLE
jgi:hypothetical protein